MRDTDSIDSALGHLGEITLDLVAVPIFLLPLIGPKRAVADAFNQKLLLTDEEELTSYCGPFSSRACCRCKLIGSRIGLCPRRSVHANERNLTRDRALRTDRLTKAAFRWSPRLPYPVQSDARLLTTSGNYIDRLTSGRGAARFLKRFSLRQYWTVPPAGRIRRSGRARPTDDRWNKRVGLHP